MRLKRLVLTGFKSFADRTEFVFDSDLTCIIGPNGCGKSNVVDAVKWVLGSQRPSALRGREMLDVVFAGAEGRAPAGVAEVELVLDFGDEEPEAATPVGDDARVRPGELSIGRRLFRSGESQYLLQGREVRLKDVREALLDTGLGVGGYAVMEQGEIDALLSANPEERRKVFDEAAGISRYKLRRREALRKLERTEQNLARVEDLRREKASRLRSLKIQATRARTWREARARLMALETAVAMAETRELGRRLAALDERLSQAEAALARARARRSEAEARKAAIARALEDLGARLERSAAELAAAEGAVREAGEAFGRAEAEAQRRRTAAREIEGELETLTLELRRQRRAAGELAAELAGVEEGLERLGSAVPELERRAAADRRAQREAQRALERVRAGILDLLHRRTQAANRAREAELEIESARRQADRLAARLGALEARGAELRSERRAEERALEDLDQRLARAKDRLARQTTLVEDVEEAQRAAAARLKDLTDRRTALASELRLLEGLEAAREGVGRAARELLAEGGAAVRRLVEGIDCPLALGPALEAVLGARVQALLVSDRSTALAALRALEEDPDGGELHLLEVAPPASDEVPEAPPRPLPPPPEGRPLLDYLGLTPALAERLGPLLAEVLVVPDLAAAERLRAGGERRTLVTPAGTVVDGPWWRAGRLEPSAGLVQRRSAIAQLRSELAAVEDELAQAARASEELEEVLGRHLRRRARLEFLREGLERRRHAQEQRLGLLERALADWRARCELERGELEDCRERVRAARAALMRPLLDRFLLDRARAKLEEAQAGALEELRAAEARQRASQAALAEAQRERARLEAERRGLAERRALLDERAAELRERAARGAERLAAERAAGERAGAEALAALAAAGEAVGRVEARRRLVAELDEERRAQRAEADRLNRLSSELEELFEARRAELEQLRLERRQLELERAATDRRIRERFGIELPRLRGEVEGYGLWLPGPLYGPEPPEDLGIRARVLETALRGPLLPPDHYRAELELPRLWEAPDFDAGEARRECRVLEARIARMGNVNPEAEAELAREEAEVERLERDCRDLEAARRHLRDTILQINEESRKLFEETFARARTCFQEIFRILFQGGKADIRLLPAEDPLEAGIEIVAQPPGKELQSIRLLSGGERSLTALAILFALFKVKPSPFCILDEVDAALDETNVERFLRVLRQFTGKTQFLVITHHKRTMAACPVLYGVTMPRKGVSARMSVRLEDVESGRVDEVLDGRAAGGRARAHPARDPGVELEVRARRVAGPDPGARRIAGEEPLGFELD